MRAHVSPGGMPRRFAFVLAALASLLAFQGVAHATGTTRKYTATVSPTTAVTGATTTLRLTLANSASSTKAMGSANITLPAGLVVTGVGMPITPPGKVWTAAVVAGVLQLRSASPGSANGVAPGKSVAVDLSVVVPSSPGTLVFATRVKQSYDFGGYDDFTRVGYDPKLTVKAPAIAAIALAPSTATVAAGSAQAYTVTTLDPYGHPVGDVTASSTLSIAPNGSCTVASCVATTPGAHTVTAHYGALTTTASLNVVPGPGASLRFTVQPTRTVVGDPISPAVKVTLLDAYGNVATGSSATITLVLRANASGAVLGGTTSRAAGAGVATFADLTVSASATGLALVATSPGLASATSADFDAPLVVVACPATGCSGSTGSSATPANPAVANVTVPAGGKAGLLVIGSDPSASAPTFCGGHACVAPIVTVLPPGSNTPGASVRVSLTYDKSITGHGGVKHQPVYVDAGSGPKLTPDCKSKGEWKGTQVLPCVDKRKRTGVGDLVIEVLIAFAVDPRISIG